MNLYKEELIDHFKNPRNYGNLENPDITTIKSNPSCGDSVQLQIILNDQVIKKINFTGKGCVISQSAASILTQFFVNKNLNEILEFKNNNILDIIGIKLGPTREKCALLAFDALQNGIINYVNNQK